MTSESIRYTKAVLTVVTVSLFVLLSTPAAAQSNHSLRSPDQRIEIRIRVADRIRYDVVLNGQPLLQDSTLSLKTESATLGLDARVKNAKPRTVDQWIEPAVRQKFAKLRENYNELRLDMEGNYAVLFRAYNEGVAYRLETNLPAVR